ncbi:hypothetical protein K492DRAFT_178312 [Lichtheimia hyalospora FSU 10163]|nr:hypothetical protein K492DRAFT_178312 [Lichtheimia hyalospora FSU 10163]
MKQNTVTSAKDKTTQAKVYENRPVSTASSSSSSPSPSPSSSSPSSSLSTRNNIQPFERSSETNAEARKTADVTLATAPAKRHWSISDQQNQGKKKRRKERFSEIDVEMFFEYWRRARPQDQPIGITRRLTEKYMEGRQYQKHTGQEDVDWIWFDVLDKFMKRLQSRKNLDLDHLLDDQEQLHWNIPPMVTAKDKLPQLGIMTEDKVLDSLKDYRNQDLSELVAWTELASDWIDKHYNESLQDAHDMRTYMGQYADRLGDFISKLQRENRAAKSST